MQITASERSERAQGRRMGRSSNKGAKERNDHIIKGRHDFQSRIQTCPGPVRRCSTPVSARLEALIGDWRILALPLSDWACGSCHRCCLSLVLSFPLYDRCQSWTAATRPVMRHVDLLATPCQFASFRHLARRPSDRCSGCCLHLQGLRTCAAAHAASRS